MSETSAPPQVTDPVLLESRLKTAETAVIDAKYKLGILERELGEIRAGMVKSGQITDRQLELGEE